MSNASCKCNRQAASTFGLCARFFNRQCKGEALGNQPEKLKSPKSELTSTEAESSDLSTSTETSESKLSELVTDTPESLTSTDPLDPEMDTAHRTRAQLRTHVHRSCS